MGKIDTAGTYIGEVLELGVSLTSTKKPQAVIRLKAVQKYVSDLATMQHFQITEPAYVAWDSYDEEIVGFLLLFNSTDEFNAETKMLNYEQLQLALGWNGQSFGDLANGSFVGKRVMFRVDEDTYNDKTSLKVNWIDAENASPERSLKTLDADTLKGLDSLLKIAKPKTPVKPAAAAAKPATPAKPSAKPTTPTAPAPSAAAPAASPATPSAPAPKSPSKPATKPPQKAPAPAPAAAPAPVEESAPALANTSTQEAAWAYVTEHKGANEDGAIEDAWLAACNEVGADRNESDFTEADWAKVRNIVIRDLALS